MPQRTEPGAVPRARPPVSKPERFQLALLGMTVAALALRLLRLGHQSLWIDEVLSYDWIQEQHKRGLQSLLGDLHGPLHALALYAVSFVSTDEWWLRLPSAIAGTLSVPALGLFGRALWGRRAGLTAAALLGLSPFSLYYSQECRNYAFSILFAILCLAAALAYARRPTPRRAALLVGAELLSILSNLNGLFFLLGLNAWLLLRLRHDRRALLAWLAGHALLAGLLASYAWEVKHQVRPERLVGVETPDFGQEAALRGETTLHPLALPYTGFAFAAGYSLGPSLGELRIDPRCGVRSGNWPMLALVGLGFAVPLGAALATRGAPGRGLLLASALTTCGFTLWLAGTNMKPYNVRYLSVALPAFLLLVGFGLWRLPRRWRLACAVAAAIVSLWSCWNYLFVPRYARDDLRGVVDYVATHAAPDDAVLQISLTGPLRYYTRLGKRPVRPPTEAGATPEQAQSFVASVAPRTPVIWYIECRPEVFDPHRHLRKALQASARQTWSSPFSGIMLYRFQIAPGAAPG